MPTAQEISEDLTKEVVKLEEAQNHLLDEWKSFSKKDKSKAGGLISKIQSIKEDLVKLQLKIEKEKVS